jgi:flagellar hook-basal body complex protein FliE
MTINPASAALAYAKAAMQEGAGDPKAAPQGASFADHVKQAIDSVAESSKNAEGQMISSAAKDSELVDVVTAVTAAELTLETVVAVRDRMVSAYQEIMKMPI